MNRTSVSQSPVHGAAAMSPGVSPIKETESEDDQDSDSEKEENVSETSLHEKTILNNTLSLACGNIDRSISYLKDSLIKNSNDNAGVLKKLETQTQTLSVSSNETKQKVQTMYGSHKKMEKEIVTISTSQNTMNNDIAKLKMDVAKILDIVTVIRDEGILKKSEKKDVATMTVKFSSDGKPIHEVPQKAEDRKRDKSTLENGAASNPNSRKPETTDTPTPSDTNDKWSFVRDSTPYVNDNTENLILSDSLSRDVDQNKLDPRGLTQVKSFGGATSSSLERKLANFRKCNNVREVITHIGFNDTQSTIPMPKTNMTRLLDSIERKFPRAKITVSAVLPTKYGYIEKINNFNKAAAEVCSARNVKFRDFGSEFLNEKSLYSDKDGDNVHLADPELRFC